MNNQILLVFDSLRWDIFKKAKTPFLKSLGKWEKAYTPGTYTFPAIMSFFVGKLPQSYSNRDYYDTAAARFHFRGKRYRNMPLWCLSNPESPRPARINVDGENIIEGFKKQGYQAIGTGAVNWFNPNLAAGRYLTESFHKFRFFDGPNYASHESADQQIDWALSTIKKSPGPYFLFINFGETHHQFLYKNCPWHDEPDPYGNSRECKRRQKGCIQYLDGMVKNLLESLEDYDLAACSDHGEAMGENGLWGHGFFHKTIIEVPLLIKAGKDK
jgi:hypothetical protein